jgi:hypothetical protein
VRRIVGAGLLALSAGDEVEGPAIVVDVRVVFEQALVDRAQLLDVGVGVVDPTADAAAPGPTARPNQRAS